MATLYTSVYSRHLHAYKLVCVKHPGIIHVRSGLSRKFFYIVNKLFLSRDHKWLVAEKLNIHLG